MIKVITYGTFDLFHYGHQRLLERAKELGDYLIVGVTTDDFDKKRGKINVKQSLMERIESVRAAGIADEIIVEEYEGQKIDDIKRFDVDIFTVGSDWIGKFDYLKEFCDVIYLDRTVGVSSSDIRSEQRNIKLGLVGDGTVMKKFYGEIQYVNGIEVGGICIAKESEKEYYEKDNIFLTDDFDELLGVVDAIFIVSHPSKHYEHVKKALTNNIHVLCESPIALSGEEYDELLKLSNDRNLILMDSIKTAYSTAYGRLLVLIKGGNIGGPTALLPIFELLGTNYIDKDMISLISDEDESFDLFTKINFRYKDAVASIKVANGVKSEGDLIISGTEGYAYVPSPWWKTDYFELRFENPELNKKYFYQLDGEGIRYELVAFAKAIELNKSNSYISHDVSKSICCIMEDFINKDIEYIK